MPRNLKKVKEIAKERIEILFQQAAKAKTQALANRYVTLARKIQMKARIRMPPNLKRKFCKHCYNYFKAKNYRVRTKDKKVIYTCLKCKKYSRYPFKKEK